MEAARPEDLIYFDEHGLLGGSYYFLNRDKWNITEGELAKIGITNDRVQVHKDIIPFLKAADKKFQERGLRIYIKEGYRSPALYKLVFDKRVDRFGERDTNRLLDIKDKPHATGRAVDVGLWDTAKREEGLTRSNRDELESLLIGFYKDKNASESKRYQELQEYIISTMLSCGFHLGKLGEYFHFNYF